MSISIEDIIESDPKIQVILRGMKHAIEKVGVETADDICRRLDDLDLNGDSYEQEVYRIIDNYLIS